MVLVVALSIALGIVPSAALANGDRGHEPRLTPVIFVHGGAGSGAQFESQKMRFTSNGYPRRYVRTVDYDSLFTVNTREDVYAKIDALVAELQPQTGKAKVDILGHSLGTSIMHDVPQLAGPGREREPLREHRRADRRDAAGWCEHAGDLGRARHRWARASSGRLT